MTIGSANVQDTIVVYETKSGGISTKSGQLLFQHSDTYTAGTGNNQINECWSASRTLAASANETLDFNGVLTDDFGDIVSFTSIKDIMIQNTSTTGSLTIGATGSNAFAGPASWGTQTTVIPPGGKVHYCNPLAGWTVTPATGDLLKFLNNDSSNPLTYNISILGIQ